MNTYLPLLGFIFLLSAVPLAAQSNTTLPNEFTEKGIKSSNRIQPFKRVVYFGIDEIDLDAKAKGILDNLYRFLAQNEKAQVEITGHSNGSCETAFCEEIANQRAEVVAFYLFEKGLSPIRLQYNGLGKKRPAASNRTTTGRQKNQRVEIRVFSAN